MILKLRRLFSLESPLLRYVANVTSQFGEDGILAHIIKVIEPENRFCVEFGAWDGKHCSNCNTLLKDQGRHGVMIEASEDKFDDLVKTFARDQNVILINQFVDFEGDNTLDNILRDCDAPKHFGVLSIDIDGNDYYVWESLTEHVPEIVVIEFNPTVPNDVVFVQEKSFDVNQGCSLLALIELGKRKGYELAVCTQINAIFVRAEKFALLGIQSNFIHHMYTPLRDGRIFHGYDGYVHVTGFNKMMWIDQRPISSADFQIYTEEERVWSDAVERQDK